MFYKIVASDLDGTLLTPDNYLTDFTKKIIRLLNFDLKVNFIVATGRHYNNVIPIQKMLNVNIYIITANGSQIYDPNGNLIVSYVLDSEIVRDLLCMIHNDPEVIINIFKTKEWLINKYQYNQELFLKNWGINYKVYQNDMTSYDDVNKIYFTSNNCQKLLFLESELKKKLNDRINISFSFPTCLEIVPGGVSKGSALKYVANLLGCELKDCISFGDSMNDKEMLEMTGKGCIMYNAQQKLKDTLSNLEVIGSNKNEAVPNYLRHLYF